jgi:hypothetical protein
MQLPVRQLVVAMAMGSLSIGAFALGWWQEDDARRRATGASANAGEWRLPKPIVSDLSADTTILLARRPFGAAGERANPVAGATVGPGVVPGPGSGTATQWRIGGIVTTETSRRLVILLRQPGQNSDRAELRQIGESLPDGSVIRAVDWSSVTVDRQGTVDTVRMFVKN